MPLNELIAQAARKGAAMDGCHGKMCGECAFKPGTIANLDEDNLMNVMGCLINNKNFHCHIDELGNKEGDQFFYDETPVCAGYLYAKQYYDHAEVEAEREDFILPKSVDLHAKANIPSKSGSLTLKQFSYEQHRHR